MARVSRRDKIAELFTASEASKKEVVAVNKKYRTGIYVRLSVEDGGLGKESDSLHNQEQLIIDYVDGMPDLELVKIYRDNGETGTDFDRPGFDLMMKDLKNGHINCIVVKDLSRFGRNYIETGEYIEKIFPFMETRFISVLEHFDNADPNSSSKDLLVNLKNLMNEAYAKDKSMRICSALDAKKKSGEFNVKNAPFGYKLSGDKKAPYVIDEPAAAIVREIYALKQSGESIHSVMRIMDEKYPTPKQYLYKQGLIKSVKEDAHWDMTAISRILSNPVYLGHMVRGKTIARLYQGVKKQVVPKEEWEIIENVNEPIVEQETFDEVQELIKKESDKALAFWGNSKTPENLFKGILRCHECGRIMYRGRTAITPTNIIRYYGCPKYRDHKERGCSHKSTIREELLKNVVLAFIKSQCKLADELENRIVSINTKGLKKQCTVTQEEKKTSIHDRIEKLEFYLRSSFESYLSGVLSESDYLFNRAKYEAEIQSCRKMLERMDVNSPQIRIEDVIQNPYVIMMRKFSRARTLTREMCVALIESIEVDKSNNITIVPKFKDEFTVLCKKIEDEESEMKQNE